MGVTLGPLRPDVLKELAARWPEHSWRIARVTHGAFHFVVLVDDVAFRIRVGTDRRSAIEAEASLTSGMDIAPRERARASVAAALDADPRGTVACHGDFGPHNVLVDADRVGLIDPDAACAGEPATDVAPLLAWYPAADLARDVSPAVLARARVLRRILPLQVAAAAELAGDAGLRDHALGNFVRRCGSYQA